MAIHQATVTMTIATPCVVTWTGHGLTTGTPIGFITTGALPTGVNALGAANSMFYVIAIDADTFNIASSPANAASATKVNTSGTQSGTHTGMEPAGLDSGNPQASLTFTVSSTSIAWTAHNLLVGGKVQLAATAMPTNFLAGIAYYVQSVVDADHVTLSASYGGSVITCGASAGTSVTGQKISDTRLGEQKVTLSNVPLAVNITLTNIVTGSQVRVAKSSDNTELYNGTASASSVVFSAKFAGNATVTVRKAGYQEYDTTIVVDSVNGGNAYISQSVDGTS